MYYRNMTIETDLTDLTKLIDEMLADIGSTNIVETPKVVDFVLDARILVEQMKQGLSGAHPVLDEVLTV